MRALERHEKPVTSMLAIYFTKELWPRNFLLMYHRSHWVVFILVTHVILNGLPEDLDEEFHQ